MSGYEDDGDGPKLWTIYNQAHGLFWRSGGGGYTTDVCEAGLFSESFARHMTGPSYADRHECARHLSSFRYVLREAREHMQKLEVRFAALAQPASTNAVDPVGRSDHELTTRDANSLSSHDFRR